MDIQQKINELTPSELIAVLTLLIIIIGGANLYSYHLYLGLNFLVDGITISQLIVSTFKSILGLLLSSILGFLLYKLGASLCWIISLYCSNLKEEKPRVWAFIASIPSICIYLLLSLKFGIELNLIVSYLIFLIALALIFKSVNQNFSRDDVIILLYIVLSFFSFGTLEAKIDTNKKFSLLPKVLLNDKEENKDWRIIKKVNDQVLVINIASTKYTEYKMIKLDGLNFQTRKNEK